MKEPSRSVFCCVVVLVLVLGCTYSYFLVCLSWGCLEAVSSWCSSRFTLMPVILPIMGLKCLTQVVGPTVYIWAPGGSDLPTTWMLNSRRGVMDPCLLMAVEAALKK